MSEYLAWWAAGGVLGMGAALLVVRYRGVLTPAAIAVFPLVTIGCLYGAKVQFRLAVHPVVDAVLVPPREVLEPGFFLPLGPALALVVGLAACRLLGRLSLQMLDAFAMQGGRVDAGRPHRLSASGVLQGHGVPSVVASRVCRPTTRRGWASSAQRKGAMTHRCFPPSRSRSTLPLSVRC